MEGGQLFRDSIIPPYMVAEDLVPYCQRHTFCTDLQDDGIAINAAQELIGHSDISLTSRIYTHYTEASLNNAAKLLQQYKGKNLDNFNKNDVEFCNTNGSK